MMMMMFAMDMLVLVLLISSLGSVQQLVAGQDVEIRSPNVEAQTDLDGSPSGSSGGGTGGGQSRTIYSQRHLSPHRMMHFGKRPANTMSPTIETQWPIYYDLMPAYAAAAAAAAAPSPARQANLQQRQQQDFVADNYLPFQFSLELENGQTLVAVPEETASSYQLPIKKNVLYSYGQRAATPINNKNNNQLTFAMNDDTRRAQQLLRQLNGQRQLQAGSSPFGQSQRLVDNDDSSKSSNDAEVNNGLDLSSSPERAQEQQQANAINISTRSIHSSAGRSNTLSLPKAYFSTLMYGRQGSSSAQNFGTYNKKAEPKENFFMHFGKK